jgi:hypothetical protein
VNTAVIPAAGSLVCRGGQRAWPGLLGVSVTNAGTAEWLYACL